MGKFFLLILISSSISLFEVTVACNTHSSYHEGPHGGCATVKSHTLFDGTTGLHFQGEWNTNADFDLETASTEFPTGSRVTVDDPKLEFNSNQAVGFHTGDTNGKIDIPNAVFCGNNSAVSCEQISIVGLVPDGTYSAKLKSFGGFYDKNTGLRVGVDNGSYEITPVLTGGLYAIYDDSSHETSLTERGFISELGKQSQQLNVMIRSNPAVESAHALAKSFLPHLVIVNANEAQLKHLNNFEVGHSRKLLDGVRTGHVNLEEAINYSLHYRGDGFGTPPAVAVDASQLAYERVTLVGPVVVDLDNDGYSKHGLLEIGSGGGIKNMSGEDLMSNIYGKKYDIAVYGRVQVSEASGGIYDAFFEYHPADHAEFKPLKEGYDWLSPIDNTVLHWENSKIIYQNTEAAGDNLLLVQRNSITADTSVSIISKVYGNPNNYLEELRSIANQNKDAAEKMTSISNAAKNFDVGYLTEGSGFEIKMLGIPDEFENFIQGAASGAKSYTDGGGHSRSDINTVNDLKSIKNSIPMFDASDWHKNFFDAEFFDRK